EADAAVVGGVEVLRVDGEDLVVVGDRLVEAAEVEAHQSPGAEGERAAETHPKGRLQVVERAGPVAAQPAGDGAAVEVPIVLGSAAGGPPGIPKGAPVVSPVPAGNGAGGGR